MQFNMAILINVFRWMIIISLLLSEMWTSRCASYIDMCNKTKNRIESQTIKQQFLFALLQYAFNSILNCIMCKDN